VCPKDCGPAVCGDGQCTSGENPDICPGDCNKFGCGDGECTATDIGPAECPEDCGTSCGDNNCEAPESSKKCRSIAVITETAYVISRWNFCPIHRNFLKKIASLLAGTIFVKAENLPSSVPAIVR
jgi:hypothetical protein